MGSTFYMAPDVGTSTRRVSSSRSASGLAKHIEKYLNAPDETLVVGADNLSLRVPPAAPMNAPIAFKTRAFDGLDKLFNIYKSRLSANEIVSAMSSHLGVNSTVSENRGNRVRQAFLLELCNVENLQGVALLDETGLSISEKPPQEPFRRPDGITYLQVSVELNPNKLNDPALFDLATFRDTFTFRLPTDFPTFDLSSTTTPLRRRSLESTFDSASAPTP